MYREIRPTGQLSQFIECLWQSQSFSSQSQTSENRVLPDGCIDLIFDVTPSHENAYWVGTMTRSVNVRSATPRSVLGIRFHPGGARSLLPCPASELVNRRVPISDLTPGIAAVLESLAKRRNPVENLEQWLRIRISMTRRSRHVMEIQQRLSVGKKINAVAKEMGYSRQYLNRIMKEEVGIDLKTFSRILRMRRLTETLKASHARMSWSDVAFSFGFYDQSHLIREFKDLVGVNPTEFFFS